MKRSAMALIILTLLLTACASTHEYMVRDSKLYIRLNKPEAKTVEFASSLDGFRLRKAEKLDNSSWQIITTAGIEFSYFYIIDGFLYLPDCKFKERDDFGMENCFYVPGM